MKQFTLKSASALALALTAALALGGCHKKASDAPMAPASDSGAASSPAASSSNPAGVPPAKPASGGY